MGIDETGFVKWQPQGRPSPYDVLQQARADAEAGRYDAALLKHDWFHRQAVTYERTPFGARLTSALADWAKLAKVYPPALEQLRRVRDEAEQKVRKSGRSTLAFTEYEALNRYLGEEEETAKTFRWLDRNRVLIAKRCFPAAMRALVKAGEFKLCGKYLNGRQAMTDSYRMYRYLRQLPHLKDFAEEQHVREAATIVALLVINGDTRGAEYLARVALKHIDTPEMRRQIGPASKGQVPEWP